MNPVLKYRGGKSREIPRFLQYIPDDFNRYIEPFFGGGAVYFYLEPDNAIINDLNTRLITEQHSELLQRTELYNLDYKKIFDMAQEDDFIFLDPPYDCVFNDYGNIDMMNGFDEEQHRRLAEEFKKLPCRALMIIGKTPLTEELYKDYIFDEYYKNYSVNIKNRFNNDKMHIVVKNY